MTELRPDNEAIFHAARDIPDPIRRREYLREACGTDESRIAHIEALLEAAAAPDSLLDQPAVGPATDMALTGPWGSDADLPLDFLAASETQGSLGRLGHYEVQEVIGRGGMGVVLKAFDERLHRVVAIKVMAPQLAASATARRRFTREARAAAAVTHDHVVTIHAVEDTGPLPYIVMQFVSGVALQDRLDRTGPLQLHEILRIGMQAALGLAAAHAQGLVHRDVKPANILLENGVERVKLTDFGLARAADDASLTQSGMIAGTPSFMSPEQAEGRPVDQRSDLFSLGSVLYAMCTGRPPFRAGTSMGVLKRVCDETPTPVREANPEVPGWLAELIAKLHAKDPAARFQSAAEVAEVLGRHLAHVQHPSQVSEPAAPGPALPLPRPRKHRWAVAAAALVAMFAVLCTTEATGVTKVRATVIRFFTLDGTLVVETDDPGVKVTVEGDGDLVITGAGPQEVRLKAGSYRLKATKDGKPVKLDRDLVAISRGDTQIVRVRLEEEPPAAVVPKAEPGAFVVIGPKGVEMRKYDTLAEAVVGASDGDTIEVRGNGPFVTEPIKIVSALTIRAGDGFRPVFNLTTIPITQAEPTNLTSLGTVAPLVLEGLEFRLLVPYQGNVFHSAVVAATALRIANCRFITANAWCLHSDPINVSPLPIWEVRNCEFLCSGDSAVAVLDFPTAHRLILENCVATANCQVTGGISEPKEPALQLTRNTFRCRVHAVGFHEYDRGQDFEDGKQKGNGLFFKATGNVFDCDHYFSTYTPPGKFRSPADAERRLAQVVGWKGERNLYSVTKFLTLWSAEKGFYDVAKPVNSLANWRQFWGTDEADSFTGSVRYQGGNLLARVQSAPEKLTPEDFRLRPDSAGYKAGKDGKDLGADVDLVGPGPAYQRWKKTPEYQQWLKETGQLRAETTKPEPGAFVVLAAGKERKFDTLAEAVQSASDGDTIEVRGNGPFVTEPITIRNGALTIRAGSGFRPVIKSSTREDAPNSLHSRGLLVLEGLELHMTGPRSSMVEVAEPGILHVANCRFVNRCEGASLTRAFGTVRNCEFVSASNAYVVLVYAHLSSDGTMLFENNVFSSPFGHALGVVWYGKDLHDAAIQLKHNTVATTSVIIDHSLREIPQAVQPGAAPARQPLRMHATANLFDAIDPNQNAFSSLTEDKLSVKEAERMLPRLMDWREERNLYGKGMILQWLVRLKDPMALKREQISEPLPAYQTLADWQRMWKAGDSGSMEGVIRYEGGDVYAKLKAAPELVTAADFRLRPDSAGYRAGKDGKDLGADVDLVGPGAAYVRWKKTPDYQQWLKETGQLEAQDAERNPNSTDP